MNQGPQPLHLQPCPDCLPPRVLLVEDDPVSRCFLAAAVAAIPAAVDSAASVAAALALAAAAHYDLWLLDSQLPDGNGADLLARLLRDRPRAVAIAHTACSEPQSTRALLAAGFDQVLLKPTTAARVQQSIREALQPQVTQRVAAAVADIEAAAYGLPLPLWDDAVAMSALGDNRSHVRAMRALFLQELPRTCEEIEDALAGTDLARCAVQLHRLRASCGFVGAGRLAAAAERLERSPEDPRAASDFAKAAAATVVAMSASERLVDPALQAPD
ncbi:MAG: response regulator [Pseudomonadota bacterium]|nr:response regulator [Pseudomonadota bacterium]